ncbi:MAG: glycoside hydrolase family 31 protein [Fimbriimonadaceae bacterium]|nr:glycoside hydrolase family 31 protein [Fimbriimonadaceae bacterium]
MYFTKVPHPANFAFATSYDAKTGQLKIGDQVLTARVRSFEGDLHHIEISAAGLWTENLNLVKLNEPQPLPQPLSSAAKVSPTESKGAQERGAGRLKISRKFEISVLDDDGNPVLASEPGLGFGVMGHASMFVFGNPEGVRYFGMGEKTFGRLELSGVRTKFWNTDVWADFHWEQWGQHTADPHYLSVPYVVIEVGGVFLGLLYETPAAPFFETGSKTTIPTEHYEPQNFLVGAEDGLPSLWIIYGPTLADVTSKLAKLVGTTPLPPLWALGYHQSRWGYGGQEDLVKLDKEFAALGIPCDGLWLDIDYMDGYRVFTYGEKRFPKGVEAAIKAVSKNGRKVVPIIDPGVKQEKGYRVFDDGKRKGVFCENPQGLPFVGMVWPGRTVFPDFSMPASRDWWAKYSSEFRSLGFAGCWVDMNDPATGAVDPQDMLFRGGKVPHRFFHNQYALGMQMATQQGFLDAAPNSRPFLLTRSGWIGTSRYSAVWTGDNVSNRHHLKLSIPTTLNLALSGIPFNGPDVGGFGGDATESLMVDWMKCCCLFPFMRNHSVFGCREQEPWRFSKRGEKTITQFIRLRYKLMPYLYNLFIEQEEEGHPAIRPLLYHFDDKKAIHDQFLVGPSILQAPFLEEGATAREVVLPGRSSWYSLETGEWLKSGKLRAAADPATTPMFVRNGSIIPTLQGERTTNEKDLCKVELHVFIEKGTATYRYRFDDGETFDYRYGKRSEALVKASAKGTHVDVIVELCEDGFGALQYEVVVYGEFKTATLNGAKAKLTKTPQNWVGKKLWAWRLSGSL